MLVALIGLFVIVLFDMLLLGLIDVAIVSCYCLVYLIAVLLFIVGFVSVCF